MLKYKVRGEDYLSIGRRFGVSFIRTLRIPDDGKTYPLPPGLGSFPLKLVSDYKDRVPEQWREQGGVFFPMYQREAVWLSFRGLYWHPNAVKVAVGRINAVTGKRLHKGLNKTRQNYMTVPLQPWIDGIKGDDGTIRQFIAMPLGMGYTVEGQITGKEIYGGLQLMVYEAKPGSFRRQRSRNNGMSSSASSMSMMKGTSTSTSSKSSSSMGLSAGGSMMQKIYKDHYGVDVWDKNNYGIVHVHIANSMMYREITGENPPTTPVTAKLYTEHGYPWFKLYDEEITDTGASDILTSVKSVKEMDIDKGFIDLQDDSTIEIPADQVVIPLEQLVVNKAFEVAKA